MNASWLVVEDLAGQYWPGAVVDVLKANTLRTRGVSMLPVAPRMFRLSGVGGYAKREWGAGWPMDEHVPRLHAPITVYCKEDLGNLHWLARLAPAGGAPKQLDGSLILVSDAQQPNPLRLGITPDEREPRVEGRALGKLDDRGGWIVGGKARCRVPQDGHYGLGLHGAIAGLRVVWLAVSQAEHG